MCVKLSSKNLNFGSCPPHSTSTYTYGVTIAPRVCGREKFPLLIALCFVEIDNAIYIHELVVVFFFLWYIVTEKIIIEDQGILHGVHRSQNRHSTFFFGSMQRVVYADNIQTRLTPYIHACHKLHCHKLLKKLSHSLLKLSYK